jgi:hypothetical protein
MTIGGAGHFFNGFNDRDWYKALLVKNYQPDNKVLQQESWKYLRELSHDENYAVDNNKYDQKAWFSSNDNRMKLLIIGNSHSKDVYNILINSNNTKKHFQIARYGIETTNILKEPFTLFSSPNYINANIIVLASRYYANDSHDLEAIVKRILQTTKKLLL